MGAGAELEQFMEGGKAMAPSQRTIEHLRIWITEFDLELCPWYGKCLTDEVLWAVCFV